MKALANMKGLVLAIAVLAGPALAGRPETHAYLGGYRVESVSRYRGGLTTDAQAEAFVGQHLLLTPDRFQVRKVVVKDPVYKAYTIPIDQKEGAIAPKDTSVFYGYNADRKEVKRIDVYGPMAGRPASYPDDSFEDLGDGRLLEMYDGWFIFLRKQP